MKSRDRTLSSARADILTFLKKWGSRVQGFCCWTLVCESASYSKMASESVAATAAAAGAEEEAGDSMATILFSISQVWRAIVADADDAVDASIATIFLRQCSNGITLSLPNWRQLRCGLAIQSSLLSFWIVLFWFRKFWENFLNQGSQEFK